jgi:hypothetical protein
MSVQTRYLVFVETHVYDHFGGGRSDLVVMDGALVKGDLALTRRSDHDRHTP